MSICIANIISWDFMFGKVCIKWKNVTGTLVLSRKAMYRRVFQSFDRDSSGRIDLSEIRDIYARFAITISPDQATQIMTFLDKDGSGDVDVEEFIDFFISQQ